MNRVTEITVRKIGKKHSLYNQRGPKLIGSIWYLRWTNLMELILWVAVNHIQTRERREVASVSGSVKL